MLLKVPLDWTAELLFGTDVVQLDLEREQDLGRADPTTDRGRGRG